MLIFKWVAVGKLTEDVEFYTNYPTEVRYYERWNEYIHVTCTRTISCGKDCTTTVTYDCSYVRNYSEYWGVYLNDGSSYYISQSTYNYYVRLWKATPKFVNMHRDYHSIDGDMYKAKWNGDFNTIDPWVRKHTYENKVQAVNSVMKFSELSEEQKKGLYDYPPVKNNEQDACLGCNISDNDFLNKLNAVYGRSKEIRVLVLVFDNPDISIAELQQSFWKGGNKNELVVCFDKNNKWAKAFSWSDDKLLETELNILFRDSSLTTKQKIAKMYKLIPTKWKRKNFSDFDYIKIDLTPKQLIYLYIITFIISLGFLLWGIHNDIDEDTFY
ncbi:hypothetical protein HYO65_gp157 [Tenacibaculum phage PTm1]|uniref:Transmembrane protein n=2 Tax=Shirahamavirus PTm1 TaxID=2846435 RepID=A0A5S9HXK2_9CAUD|nr:hypothetical protein HYO65_gp157 [Tenacibaculum phage PTm1]BBI90549.1 hypothetical protein [Tenacibaculum phage PTm1]BBI90857.1 hypothetical protein [Tenacibaculum phage PTm5]